MPRGPKGGKRPADVIGKRGPCHADRDGEIEESRKLPLLNWAAKAMRSPGLLRPIALSGAAPYTLTTWA